MNGPPARNPKSNEKETSSSHKKSHTSEEYPGDELDALISYPDESQSRRQGDTKNPKQQQKAKELVMQDTFLGAPLEPERPKNESKGGQKEKEKGKQSNTKKSQDKGSTDGKQEKGGKGNDKQQDKQSDNKRDKQSNENNRRDRQKDKQKVNDKNTGSDDNGLVVIPPAPLLTVPPPPPPGGNANTGKNSDNNSNEKSQRNKDRKGKKNDNKDQSETVKEEKKASKEPPMLVKINNPFLEQKGKKTPEDHASPSRVVSIIADGDTHVKKQDHERRRGKNERGESYDETHGFDNVKGGDTAVEEKGQSKGRKRGKNSSVTPSSHPNENSIGDKEMDESPVVSKADIMEFSRLNIHSEVPLESIHQIEIPPPRKLKKGPPAIPNKVLDDDIIIDEPPKPKVVELPVSQPPVVSPSVDNGHKKSSPHVPPPPGLSSSSGLTPVGKYFSLFYSACNSSYFH
jgi:hypothetical protein